MDRNWQARKAFTASFDAVYLPESSFPVVGRHCAYKRQSMAAFFSTPVDVLVVLDGMVGTILRFGFSGMSICGVIPGKTSPSRLFTGTFDRRLNIRAGIFLVRPRDDEEL